jgi:hypothetical protein
MENKKNNRWNVEKWSILLSVIAVTVSIFALITSIKPNHNWSLYVDNHIGEGKTPTEVTNSYSDILFINSGNQAETMVEAKVRFSKDSISFISDIYEIEYPIVLLPGEAYKASHINLYEIYRDNSPQEKFAINDNSWHDDHIAELFGTKIELIITYIGRNGQTETISKTIYEGFNFKDMGKTEGLIKIE